jgi:uncharacterized protein YeaO (DUF488 family)
MIQLERVYVKPSRNDGLRILVDRAGGGTQRGSRVEEGARKSKEEEPLTYGANGPT